RPDAALPAARAGAPAPPPAAVADRLPLRRRAGDALAQRPARAGRRRDRARVSLPPLPPFAGAACTSGRCAGRPRRHRADAAPLLRSGNPFALQDERGLGVGALPGLRLRAADPAQPPFVRPRPEQLLRLLRVRHGEDELGPALVLRLA